MDLQMQVSYYLLVSVPRARPDLKSDSNFQNTCA